MTVLPDTAIVFSIAKLHRSPNRRTPFSSFSSCKENDMIGVEMLGRKTNKQNYSTIIKCNMKPLESRAVRIELPLSHTSMRWRTEPMAWA